jgi:precorrin-2 methylase
MSVGLKFGNYIVKTVEDAFYLAVVAAVVSFLLLISTAKFPLNELQEIVKKVLEDIQYMLTVARQL